MIMKNSLIAISIVCVALSGCARQPVAANDGPISQLCVVRHAQAFKNLDPRPPGLTPEQLDSLTPEGEAQACALRASVPEGVALVWSSPMHRTQQTAALLALLPPVVVEPDLRPLRSSLPWDERMAAWERGEDPRQEDGESLSDGAERVLALLDRLRDELASGTHAVVVTHGDIASILLGELRGTPLLERLREDMLDTGQLVCLPLTSDASGSAP